MGKPREENGLEKEVREYNNKYNKQQGKEKESKMLDRFARGLKQAQEDERGFTLVELLVVVVTLPFHKRLRQPEPLPN